MKITETCLDLLNLDLIEIAENHWVLMSTVLQVMGLAESYWDLISLAESYWVLLSLAENCKVLLSLAEICWVFMRFVMHCWVCWVLLSLTESSLVLLSIVETFLIIFNHFANPTSSFSFTKGFWIGHYIVLKIQKTKVFTFCCLVSHYMGSSIVTLPTKHQPNFQNCQNFPFVSYSSSQCLKISQNVAF